MVKITNAAGDVKVGKQGGMCYQRFYGNQVRREVKPKKPLPSPVQNTQRQLFIQGLAFRKALTREEKMYLDGYCLYHRLVDTLGVPLTWDRFAMKICLERPRLTILPPA
jgi:hypothetical protein